jgi:hypothetical protein
VTADSISANAIYANSGSPTAVEHVLTAPGIVLAGISGTAATIDGTLVFDTSDQAQVYGDIAGPGGIRVEGGGSLALFADLTLTGEARVAVGELEMRGNSIADGSVVVESGALLTPGGVVDVGELTVESGGFAAFSLTSSVAFDVVQVAATASLDGVLRVNLVGGYEPTVGTSFEIIGATTLTGSFALYEGLRYGSRVLRPDYTGTTLTLVAEDVPSGASQPLNPIPGGGVALNAGDFYDGLTLTSTLVGGLGTEATIIGGTATAATTVTGTFLLSGSGFAVNGTMLSDIFEMVGSGTDKFVLQMDYEEGQAIAQFGTEDGVYLAWWDGLAWVNAVDGNTDIIGEPNTPTQFLRAYNPATDFYLGYYGVDSVNNRVWAVVNHNSFFGAVPEPTSAALVAFGLLPWLRRRRGRG